MASLSTTRPCIIYRPAPGWGFWSNFTCVLQGLDYADLEGYLPVVDMERHRTRYSEENDETLLGTRNAWEYFFEQPSGIGVSEALQLDPIEYQGEILGRFTLISDLTRADEVWKRGQELVGKYVRVKPEVLARANEIIPSGIHPEVMGVHVRGTDMRRGYHALHPIPGPSLRYLEEAVALDRQHKFQHIFLASDEEETIGLFREHFGTRLLTIPAYRTSAAQDFSTGYEWLFESKRELHRYHLGLEVLLDVLLLARCGYFVCGCSNITTGVRYLSNEHQVVRYVAPLWRMPGTGEASVGRAFVSSFPPALSAPSQAALSHQIGELERILEVVENSRAEAMHAGEVLQTRLADAEHTTRRVLTELEAARSEAADARKEAAAARKAQEKEASHLSHLENRILHLMDWWTWLGWRLRPWKKPSWRHAPLMPRGKKEQSDRS